MGYDTTFARYNYNAPPRGFAVAKGFEDKGIVLPYRTTKYAAGYDFTSPVDVTIEPQGSAVIHSGVKAWMQPDEVLKLYIRSSLGIRKGITQGNSVSIIDADYYGNTKNDGEIVICLRNLGDEPQIIRKGERIVQGIFQKYLTCGDEPDGVREGGVGSTGN